MGQSYHAAVAPDAVCFAESTEDVAAIVKACARHKTPIIPFGGGTSLEGHVSAPYGGVSLDVSRMNNVLEVRPGDLDTTVQARVTRQQLNDHLRDTGLFFSVDPGAESRWAAWQPRARPAPTPYATAPCARTSWG